MVIVYLKVFFGGWGLSSAVERLPSKRKAPGSVPSSEKKNQKKKKSFFLSLWKEVFIFTLNNFQISLSLLGVKSN